LALTVGIAVTGFCYPGGILQLFLSTRSANFSTADSSKQQPDHIKSTIIYIIKIFNALPSRIAEFVQIDELRNEKPKSSSNSNFTWPMMDSAAQCTSHEIQLLDMRHFSRSWFLSPTICPEDWIYKIKKNCNSKRFL
jgi:hypothetical protein